MFFGYVCMVEVKTAQNRFFCAWWFSSSAWWFPAWFGTFGRHRKPSGHPLRCGSATSFWQRRGVGPLNTFPEPPPWLECGILVRPVHASLLSYQIVLKNFHPHLLRHTSACLSITEGADYTSTAERLGHSEAVLLRKYSHASKDSIRRAGEAARNAKSTKVEEYQA